VIVVDTSALIAVVMNEPTADPCSDSLAFADEVLISAPTLTETLVVAQGRGRRDQMAAFLSELAPTVCDLSEAVALHAADAYRQWGRGFHRARLNFGDCFAYALAKDRDCPLLFVGDDFSQTDVVPALPKT
jgi:ribonuclease VapC